MLINGVSNPFIYNDSWIGINIINTIITELTSGANGAFKFSLLQLSVAVLDTNLGAPASG